MSENNPSNYAKLLTRQLEDMLKQPGLSASVQQQIQDELTKRYTEDLLKGTKTGVSEPRQPVTPFPSTSLPQEVIPVPRKPTKRRIMSGCVGIAILIFITMGLLFVCTSNGSDSSFGTVCVTNFGSCPLLQAVPTGMSCYCTDGNTQVPGVVQ